MTTYAKDFSDELTTGVFPSDFTDRYATISEWTVEATTDAEDDRSFNSDGTGTGIQLASWDDIDGDGSRVNSEILCRFRTGDTGMSNAPTFWMRASGSTGTEDGYVMTIRSTGNWQFYRYEAGAFNALTETVNADAAGLPPYIFTSDRDPAFTTYPQDLWTYIRFRVNGTGATVELRGKIWMGGLTNVNEPKDWHLISDDTDANRITTAGWTGVGRQSHATNDTIDVDYFAVGTNGDTAPLNASTNTVIRMTAIWAEVMGENANPQVNLTQHWVEVMGQTTNPSARVAHQYVMVAHDRDVSGATDDVSGQLIVTT